MTLRRPALIPLAIPLAVVAALWVQHARDHLGGWYDPRWRT